MTERAGVAAPAQDVGERIAPARLHAWLSGGEPVLVLDVRRRQRWAADPARIPGAAWVPFDELPRRARDLPRDRRLVVYCS